MELTTQTKGKRATNQVNGTGWELRLATYRLQVQFDSSQSMHVYIFFQRKAPRFISYAIVVLKDPILAWMNVSGVMGPSTSSSAGICLLLFVISPKTGSESFTRIPSHHIFPPETWLFRKLFFVVPFLRNIFAIRRRVLFEPKSTFWYF